MHPKLFAELFECIDRWLDDSMNSGLAPDGYVGNDLALLMASAAENVYDAVFESQKHALDDGYYKPGG